MRQSEHRPGGSADDQCEKNKFGDNTGPLALGEPLTQEAKRPQAHRSFRIKQLTISPVAA